MNYASSLRLALLAGAFLLVEAQAEPGRGWVPVSVDLGTPANAVIGRPLTPLSYAGVARRTTRRAVMWTTTTVAVLPAGCVYGAYYGGYYYRCGSGYYAKSGNVYVRVVVQ